MKKKTIITVILFIFISILFINGNYVYAKGKGSTETHTMGDIIKDAKGFIEVGEREDPKIDQGGLKNISITIYNILLVLGIVTAVVTGLVLGIKFITEGVEGKAEVLKTLIPYVIGCVVVFGGFAIWKIVVDILQSV